MVHMPQMSDLSQLAFKVAKEIDILSKRRCEALACVQFFVWHLRPKNGVSDTSKRYESWGRRKGIKGSRSAWSDHVKILSQDETQNNNSETLNSAHSPWARSRLSLPGTSPLPSPSSLSDNCLHQSSILGPFPTGIFPQARLLPNDFETLCLSHSFATLERATGNCYLLINMLCLSK